ncbi:8-oxo-dGTP diphosphatase MutT [Thalassotalea profundi]|uniref:8-oxo-dGTP diphosphatase n=1 Tax=Thalassotalea profundi TaxID=2036687 RepID=A0ABQ3J0R2_9GAMM|nr:8-oxo-dGTP diphosphatase MutT [Thalassotalea profundi]GHE95083.1 7,8-dihydro-8-oxoguanine-triphosphatase [Thalassotalea profundi]
MTKKRVHVAVGVILSDKQVFLTKRAEHVHQGGKWEFPGGKVETGESVAQALYRELKEEIGIEVLSCLPLVEIAHDYPDKSVLLEVFVVDNYLGEPSAQEGQQESWFDINDLSALDFPEANQAIIEKLEALLL